MSKKSIFFVAVLCLLGITSYSFAGQYTFQDNWHNTTNDAKVIGAKGTLTADWFDGNNWGRQIDTQYNKYGPRPHNPATYRAPDWANLACIEPKTPDPCIDCSSPYASETGGANCSTLTIQPWSWAGAPNIRVTVNCNFNCGYRVGIGEWMDYSSETQGFGILDVNGGTITTPGLRNFDANYPYVDDPTKYDDANYPWIMAEGLRIGGGSSTNGACKGVVNLNGGNIDVPRVQLYYGEVNIFPGCMLYIHSPNDLNLTISLSHNSNMINVAGGEFRFAGDRRDRVNYYVGKSKILAYQNRGMLSVAYDSGMDATRVTAVGSNANAWKPTPTHQALNIVRNPTLTWNAGDYVNNGTSGGSENPKHHVYFGTDETAVTNATTASLEYKGAQDAASYAVSGLEADTTYYWRIDEVNDFDSNSPWKGWVWNFRTLGGSAIDPIPADQTLGLTLPLQLSWTSGAFAVSHELYIGVSEANVTDATLATAAGMGVTEVDLTSNTYALGSLSWDLAKDTNYFWRIDEVNGANRWKGFTWMFRNTNYFIVDDFNNYDDSADMNTKWETGFVNNCYGDISHAGLNLYNNNAMQLTYTNTTGVRYSEARFIANGGAGCDWTGGGALPSGDPVVNVAVSFLGAAGNTADATYDRMYMALEDTSGNFYVKSIGDANATRNFDWSVWSVSLADLGVGTLDLASVRYLYLGAGDRAGCNIDIAGGTGTITFDDVRLYQRHCVADYNKPIGDLTNDCVVNYDDLDYMVNNWLTADTSATLAVSAPSVSPIAWYKFDESGGTTAYDSAGPNNATVLNPGLDSALWSPTGGFDGSGCINLVMNASTLVEIPPAVLNFLSVKNSITLSVWIKMDYYSPTNEWARLISAWEPNASGTDTEVLETQCPTPRPPSNSSGPTVRMRWSQADATANDDNQSAQMSTLDFARVWNHYAFVKDASSNHIMRVYHNGYVVVENNNTQVVLPTPPLDGFRLGCRLDSQYEQHWVGSIDDFRVYDKALSAAEIAYIGTRGTGSYSHAMADAAAVANVYTADTPGQRVNFRDWAVIASHWLQQAQWP